MQAGHEQAGNNLDLAPVVVPACHGGALDAQGLALLGRHLRIWPRPGGRLRGQTMAWQAATVFFAVIDLVAAVGLGYPRRGARWSG